MGKGLDDFDRCLLDDSRLACKGPFCEGGNGRTDKTDGQKRNLACWTETKAWGFVLEQKTVSSKSQPKKNIVVLEGGRTELDANANRVLRPADEGGTSRDVKEEDENSSSSTTSSSSAAARLGTTALAALTDLCGRQLLSPAFFLGPSSSSPLNVSGESGGQHAVSEAGQQPDKAVLPASKPRLYLRSHKMAGLKDLLMSEKLNTHAISLQLTAQSQVQLGGRAKNNAARAEAAAADALNNPAATGSPAPNNNKDGADSGKHPDAAQSVPSRPKRTRKE